jgi:formate dehydrogenase maturation protein FdhE
MTMADPLKAMTSLMMDKMLAHMSTEEIQAMMREMMTSMFSGLDLADKITFMQAMMEVCIPRLTEGLNGEEREQLAETVLAQMAAHLREAQPAAPTGKVAPDER